MINFRLNGIEKKYEGDESLSLLRCLREIEGIISVKDGCSGQAACGACMVEMDGKPTLSCVTPMKKVAGKEVITIEGFPGKLKKTLTRALRRKRRCSMRVLHTGTPGEEPKILLQNNPRSLNGRKSSMP